MLARLANSVRRRSLGGCLRPTAFFSTEPEISRFDDVLQSIHHDVDAKKKPSVGKLTLLFRIADSRQQLVEATKALRVFEVNFVDPAQKTAGEFIKASIAHDAGDIVLKVLQQHHRIGLFVNAGSFNNLFLHFYKKQDHANALALFQQLKQYKVVPNAATYDIVLRHMIAANHLDQLVELLAVAADAKKLKANTLNHILIQLVKLNAHDYVAKVNEIVVKHDVPQNEVTKTLLPSQ
ncbi:hypothetical protein LEN26_010421 [Aphanomyces euteiches]|nr:hypothetical protein AeMF1_009961 [Aphanomyces euteiches]KAH9122086.1 hypothetical protein LEN26_010421 [Aphanomyces euteiches]KAH9196557.1 hypothetical protein AeNC1_001456 [Aphanomyces euteiches]